MKTLLQKRIWVPTLTVVLFIAILFVYQWCFFQGNHELLEITKACRKEYICKIIGENVIYSHEELGRQVSDDPRSYNSEFYIKYHGMYEEGHPYYILTPEEVMELVYSRGPEKDVFFNWKNTRWNTYTVYKDGSIEGESTPWPEVGTAAVRELQNS